MRRGEAHHWCNQHAKHGVVASARAPSDGIWHGDGPVALLKLCMQYCIFRVTSELNTCLKPPTNTCGVMGWMTRGADLGLESGRFGHKFTSMSNAAATSDSQNGLNEVYNRRILELAGDIPRIGVLKDADASASAISKMCGSKVTVHLKVDGGAVTDFSHQVHACALGQASSSVMGREVIGSTRAEIEAVRDTMRAMLKEGGEPPTGKWSDLEVLAPARDFKNRHQSILLTFEAVLDAMGQTGTQAEAGTQSQD